MYQGGKNGSGTYQKIINWIPPHEIYIEAFLGSGAIVRYKKPAAQTFGFEIDAGVIDKFVYPEFCTVENVCAISRLKEMSSYWKKNSWNYPKENVFIYVDPPYPKGSRRSAKDIYNYEMTDRQHIELLKTLLSMPARIAISTYKNPIYERMLKKWNLIKFTSQTRKGAATEYLYMNYPEPTELHDYSFLGEDFIDRQRIKRKIDRHVERLLHLPVLERKAIINSIAGRIEHR